MDQLQKNSTPVSKTQNLVDERNALVEKWQRILANADAAVEASFLSVSKSRESFGILSMPDDFVHSFGAMLPIRIGLSCRNIMWVVKYDLQQREIIGLSKFMRYYGMKIFNMAQLDYYGEGLFVVSLFKDTALELNYPVGMPKDLNMSKEWEEQNRDDYVVRAGTFQLAACETSIFFNCCTNKDGYASMLILESDMEMDRGLMLLKSSWEQFYDVWEDRSTVTLIFGDRSWDVKVRKRSEVCYFATGWREFYEAVGLKEGDYIVGFRANLEQNNKLKLCIYRAADHLNDLDVAVKQSHMLSKSFFKIVHDKSAANRYLMMPFLVGELYGWKLRQIKKNSMGGIEHRFYYLSFPGYMYLLEDLLRDFRVKRNDTLIFKMNESDTLLCRVYDCNGMEIGYDYRPGKQATNRSPEWIWSFEQSTDRGQIELMKYAVDEDNMQIDESDNIKDFSTHLTEGNVDKKTHGLFIPASIKPQGGKWKRSQSIRLRTDKGVWIVGITVAGKKAIFCAGWNKFVRDNIYVAGQRLNFRLVDRSEPMEFEITKI